MNVERLPAERHGHRYARMQPDHDPDPEADAASSSSAAAARRPEVLAASASFRLSEATRVFEELPRATIFSVSRPDAGDITPMLLSYTIEINYKQVRPTLLSPFF
jgi:phospholipase D1/2